MRVLALALLLACGTLSAQESRIIERPDGQPIFELRFFDPGDGPFMDKPGGGGYESTWSLDRLQREKIATAMQYWGEVIRPVPGATLGIVNIGTLSADNAYGVSLPVSDQGGVSPTSIQAVLQGLTPGGMAYDSNAQFIMGNLDWDTQAYLPSQVPLTGRFELMPTALHELAHGLGVSSSAYDSQGEGTDTPRFGSTLSVWDTLLRDDFGNPATAGQDILCSQCSTPVSPDAFDTRQDRSHLTGSHIQEVLDGSMPGVPVSNLSYGTDGQPNVDSAYMSHIELRNSAMSHQTYRNYTSFMEAELAIMQDLGYDIDRRNFFGRSIYNDDLNVVNDQGYFQRNADGTAYLPGTYNTAMLGLGLHVYGSRNTIRQQADLLTRGPGGAGIRVDGERNDLIVEPGTRIHADGLNGRGIVFAYGRDHTLTQRGEVQAMGEHGVGVSFDFGNNALGNSAEYRGSYQRTVNHAPVALLPELEGALVHRYDLTGRVAGRAAAIHIAPSALVNHINVMRGARIEGDIVSDYRELDAAGQPRLTHLSFGYQADAEGSVVERPDPGFSLHYQGNIRGANLALSTQGGHTSLNGQHTLHSLQVMPGSTLGGNSRYTLQPDGGFVNDGTVAPGNSLGRIDIDGNYRQGPQGTLALEVDGLGRHDVLAVSGTAELDGRLAITPTPGWYSTLWQIDTAQLVQAGSTSGFFGDVAFDLRSPTLSFQLSGTPGATTRLSLSRAPQAYSRYAGNGNARQVGLALDHNALAALPGIQPLYAALDFSSPDGRDIGAALEPLSGGAYSALAAAGLERDRHIAALAAWPRPGAAQAPGSRWQAYITPFGLGTRQSTRTERAGYTSTLYGALFGAQTQRDAWTFGLYGAVSEQTVRLRAPYDGKGRSTALHLGAQAHYAPDGATGLFVYGQAQAGMDRGKLDRQLNAAGLAAAHHASWTGWQLALSLGGGYRWALSPHFSLGPVAGLHYTYARRPGVTEDGTQATRLRLDAVHASSLRGSVGLAAALDLGRDAPGRLTAQFELSWEQELMKRKFAQSAYFASQPGQGFTTRHLYAPDGGLRLKAGLAYSPRPSLALTAGVSSQFSRHGHRSLAGDVSVNWRF